MTWYFYFISDNKPDHAITIQTKFSGKPGKIREWDRERVEDHWRPLFPIIDDWIDSEEAVKIALQSVTEVEHESIKYGSFELYVYQEQLLWKINFSDKNLKSIRVDAITGEIK